MNPYIQTRNKKTVTFDLTVFKGSKFLMLPLKKTIAINIREEKNI